MIISSAQRRFTIKRLTAFVVDEIAVKATMSADRQPVRESIFQVRVRSGTSNSGTVQITGTDAEGSAINETLTFTTAGYKQTSKRFVSISPNGITTTGLADEATVPKIAIKALGPDGSIQNISYTVTSGWPAIMDRSRPSRADWKGEIPGSTEEEPVFIMLQWTENFFPREGDIFIDDDTAEQFILTGTPLLEGYGRVSHYAIWAQRRQGSV
jgi:hypothetical protein